MKYQESLELRDYLISIFEEADKSGLKGADKADKNIEKAQKEIEKSMSKSKQNEKDSRPSEENITAISTFTKNIDIINAVLWGYLNPRRKKIDDIFYKALKKNDLLNFDLDQEKSEAFKQQLSKPEKKELKQPTKQEIKPAEKKIDTSTTSTAQFSSYIPDSFDDIISEAGIMDVLKTTGKSLLGQKPTKMKEIAINSKMIYNNCVLILVIEFYLSAVLESFKKEKGIKTTDLDTNDTRNERYNGIKISILDAYGTYLKTMDNDKVSSRRRQRAFNEVQRLRSKYPTIDDTLKEYQANEGDSFIESVLPELMSEGLISAVKNLLTMKFKMVNFSEVSKEQFYKFSTYLFTNKQFFIEQTKTLTRYMGSISSDNYGYGNGFYQSLSEFNTLDEDVKVELVNQSFELKNSGFDKLFSQLDKLIIILADRITIETKKEMNKAMGGEYQAGVKAGQFVGRLFSGQSQLKPINPQDNSNN